VLAFADFAVTLLQRTMEMKPRKTSGQSNLPQSRITKHINLSTILLNMTST